MKSLNNEPPHTMLKTEEEYEQALEQLNKVFGATIGTPEGDEADRLISLIHEYEKIHYPI